VGSPAVVASPRRAGISDYDEMATDSELDDMELELPEDALWLTTKKRTSTRSMQSSPMLSHNRARAGTPASSTLHHDMPAVPEEAPLRTRPPRAAGAHVVLPRRRSTIGNDDSEYFGGQDIVYTRCSSPETVHLETDQLYHKVCEIEQQRRRRSGKPGGLWGGYCVGGDDGESQNPPAVRGPQMLSTPRPEALPSLDPFALAFAAKHGGSAAGSMAVALSAGTRTVPASPGGSDFGLASAGFPTSLSALSTAPPPQLSRRTSLIQQAAMRRAAQKVEEAMMRDKIRDEFTDHFVTQVYNYLSLGYPAMARAYDAELAKITGVPVVELCRDDDELMANGHFVDEVDPESESDDDETMRPEEDEAVHDAPPRPRGAEKTGEQKGRCPRWRALRAYVHEWARQHPNLDTLDPLVWGLQERRGSWGV
jgi:hypothetical protein